MTATRKVGRPGALALLPYLLLSLMPPHVFVAQGQAPRAPTAPTAHGKRALLIGISKYERPLKNGAAWQNLTLAGKGGPAHSAPKNDLELLASVLVREFAFDPDDIKIVSDEPVSFAGRVVPAVVPTHKVMVEAFRSFLVARTRPGDVAYFHFSGHGQQVPDDDPEEELDGYDETLVPADYVSQSDGSNNIRDDELNVLLAELGRKSPANVTVTIDSCSSGTATRGDYDSFRGGPWRGAPVARERVRGEDESFDDSAAGLAKGGRPALRNYVFLSAAAPRQRAQQGVFEGTYYGVFTYYLAKAMGDAGRRPASTYRELFDRVLNQVSSGRSQQPQMEGDQLDNVVLRDGAVPAGSYVRVKVNGPQGTSFRASDYKIVLDAGSLQGMTAGSKFELYPASVKSRGEGPPLAVAKVKEVFATESVLEAEGNVSPAALKDAARAFEVSHNYGPVLKVALKDLGRRAGLQEMLGGLGLAATAPESSAEWNVLIRAAVPADRNEGVVPADFDGLVLQRRDGSSVFAAVREGEGMYAELRKALIGEAKRVTLLSLDNTDPNIKVEMRLVPVADVVYEPGLSGEPVVKSYRETGDGPKYSKGGLAEFKVGDYYLIKIRNKGMAAVYVTILNLDAGGRIQRAFPNSDHPDNLLLGSGDPGYGGGWRDAGLFQVSAPFGLESMRAIATERRANFAPLFDEAIAARGESRGGSFSAELAREVEARKATRDGGGAAQRLEAAINSPLGQIWIATQEGRGVRGDGARLPPPSWATTAVSYTVVR